MGCSRELSLRGGFAPEGFEGGASSTLRALRRESAPLVVLVDGSNDVAYVREGRYMRTKARTMASGLAWGPTLRLYPDDLWIR